MKVAQTTLLSAALLAAENPALKAQAPALKSSPSDLVDALHSAFGEHPARAVHAKGIILEGKFTPSSQASGLTTAAHLQRKSSKVIVRFSDFTGIPDIPDNAGGANPRGFAIKFLLPDGASTDIVGHSFNGFPTHNSDEFRELLLAIGASGPNAVKPTAIDLFLASHPVAKTFLTTQHTPVSYSSIKYFGVNAFKFTNHDGHAQIVRYQFIPEEGERFMSADALANADADYLLKEIAVRVKEKPIRFKYYAQIAEPGDQSDDPSLAWPDSRKLIFLGLIEITNLAANTPEEDKALSFIPNNVPAGIETADPMLNFRSKAYPISVSHRQ